MSKYPRNQTKCKNYVRVSEEPDYNVKTILACMVEQTDWMVSREKKDTKNLVLYTVYPSLEHYYVPSSNFRCCRYSSMKIVLVEVVSLTKNEFSSHTRAL